MKFRQDWSIYKCDDCGAYDVVFVTTDSHGKPSKYYCDACLREQDWYTECTETAESDGYTMVCQQGFWLE